MVMSRLMQRFVDQAPICVLVRAVVQRQFSAERLDAIFEKAAQKQYTHELLFSTAASLLSQVAFGQQASVNAAFKSARAEIPVSIVALYEKLQRTEPGVCEALVAETFQALQQVIQVLKAERPDPVPGLRLRILDGNHLAASEHRLKELRGTSVSALPGETLAVYDDRTRTISNLICCEDAHTNERKLLDRVTPWLQANDLLLADSGFCVTDFFTQIMALGAFFLIRHHSSLGLLEEGQRRRIGRMKTGTVYEQKVRVGNAILRALIIIRRTPLRNGKKRVVLLTNVPVKKASALQLAKLYLKRWRIEETFRQLTQYLSCEVSTLGYPKAALLAFTMAVMAYNGLMTVLAALASVHGREKVDDELSTYYLAWEVRATYEGMMIAIPPKSWPDLAKMDVSAYANYLRTIAQHLDWPRYTKAKRGPKKPRIRKRVSHHHVSTARLLQTRQNTAGRRS